MSVSLLRETAQVSQSGTLATWTRPASAVCAVLWIAHYLLQLGYGLASGKVLFDANGTLLWRLDIWVFFGAYVTTGVALLGIAALLNERSRLEKYIGVAFAGLGIIGGLTGFVVGFAPTLLPVVLPFAGKSILALFIAAITLGSAHLRQKALPQTESLAVLEFGLLTLPLGLALGLLERSVPSYTVSEAHFIFSGAAWFVLSTLLRTKQH